MTTCQGCGCAYVADMRATIKCLAQHPAGECCHVGQLLVSADGKYYPTAPTPQCHVVRLQPDQADWERYALPDERSVEALVCSCKGAVCSVAVDVRAGVMCTVLQCRQCGDTRVVRSESGV